MPSKVLSPSYLPEIVVVCYGSRSWFYDSTFNSKSTQLIFCSSFQVCFWEPFGNFSCLPIGFVQATSLNGILVLEEEADNELVIDEMQSWLMFSDMLWSRDGVEQAVVSNTIIKFCFLKNSSISFFSADLTTWVSD